MVYFIFGFLFCFFFIISIILKINNNDMIVNFVFGFFCSIIFTFLFFIFAELIYDNKNNIINEEKHSVINITNDRGDLTAILDNYEIVKINKIEHSYKKEILVKRISQKGFWDKFIKDRIDTIFYDGTLNKK